MFLGVILDPQLQFDKHIKKISKAVKTNLNCFKWIINYVPIQTAQLFMHTMGQIHKRIALLLQRLNLCKWE